MEISNNYPVSSFVPAPSAEAAAEGQATVRTTTEASATPAQPTQPEVTQDAAKEALSGVGLKPTEENLKIVSLLIENKMPVNKENMLALSKTANFAGYENLKNAIVLMKNDIPTTLASIERFNDYASSGEKLVNQIKTLAESIMSMDEGPEKQKLLKIFSDAVSTGGSTQQSRTGSSATVSGAPVPASEKTVGNAAQSIPEALAKPGNTEAEGNVLKTAQASTETAPKPGQTALEIALKPGQAAPETALKPGQAAPDAALKAGQAAPEAALKAGQAAPEAGKMSADSGAAVSKESAAQAKAADQPAPSMNPEAGKQISEGASGTGRAVNNPAQTGMERLGATQTHETPIEEINTGSTFFREVFKDAKDAANHMIKYPLTNAEREFILKNADKIQAEFKALSNEGTLTKEKITSLINSMPDSEKMAEALKDGDKMKSLTLFIAEQTESLKSSMARAKGFRREIEHGAKKIAANMSLSVDKKDLSINDAHDNLMNKLSQIAKELGNSDEHSAIRKSVEDIKDNLSFLNRFKNDAIVHLPIVVNQQQKHAELYVFSDRNNKNKNKVSQSALISLNLSNLGLFETYLQKTGNAVTCQFRLKNEEIETLVRANIEKLQARFTDKGYLLNGYSFKHNDEKFEIADGEPALNKDEAVSLPLNYNFDLRM